MQTTHLRNYVTLVILYLSLIIGFFLDEKLNYGAYMDWYANSMVIKNFLVDFKKTFISYDEFSHRHSPIYYIFLSLLYDLGFSDNFVRLINLHLSLSLILVFYKCLKLKFNYVDKKILQLLSLVIFLSPTFRSLSIWPDSRLPGLILFTISIYFFLKFSINNRLKYMWSCSTFLILSSYLSPNFSLFSLYFYFYFYKKLKLKDFILLIFYNLIAALPAFFYIFIMGVNFLNAGITPFNNNETVALNFNYANKILLVSSILFFHLIPIFFYTIKLDKITEFFKKNFLPIIIGCLILMYFFDYQMIYTGGGFFFQLSQILLDNNFILFFVCFFSITTFLYLLKLDFNNFLIFLILVLSNIQNSIYHKYYEPMILIIFFTLFANLDFKSFFIKKKSLIILYTYSLGFIVLRLIKNTLI